MNVMLAPPTIASATNSDASEGASAASVIATPNTDAAITSGRSPVLPRAAISRPPATAPMPIEAVMKPNPVAPACRPLLAITGSETWNS